MRSSKVGKVRKQTGFPAAEFFLLPLESFAFTGPSLPRRASRRVRCPLWSLVHLSRQPRAPSGSTALTPTLSARPSSRRIPVRSAGTRVKGGSTSPGEWDAMGLLALGTAYEWDEAKKVRAPAALGHRYYHRCRGADRLSCAVR